MPTFTYKAKSGPDNFIDGTIEADDYDSAVSKIIRLGYTPVDISGSVDGAKEKKKKFSFGINNIFRKVPEREVMLLTRQLSDLVDAGVPLLRSLSIVEKQSRHTALKKIISSMHKSVEDGASFSSALSEHGDVFPSLYVNMIKAGELSGKLEQVLGRLADFMEEDLEIKSQIKTSLIYPSLIVILGFVTIFALLSFVIPRITVIYDDLTAELPAITTLIVSFSNLLAKFWWVLFLIVSALLLYYKRFNETEHGKLIIDRAKLRIPIIGNFIKDVEIGKFARNLDTLLDNGVNIVDALGSVQLIMGNEVFKREVSNICEQVSSGSSVSEAIRGGGLFPESVISMISVAEESGHLSKGFTKLADYYEKQCRTFIKRMTSLIEPALILFIGTIVGVIVIAMLMPIFNMDLMIR